MLAKRPSVIWICRAPGAGKSVAAWAQFEKLAADGFRVAHVDIDQLGMLYPAEDESERHRLKVQAQAALLPGYLSAGAQVVVVSGVVDPVTGPGPVTSMDVDFSVCLLRAGAIALRARILARGWGDDDVAEAIADEEQLGAAGWVDATIGTVGLTVRETVDQIRAMVIPGTLAAGTLRPARRSFAEIDTLVVTGPRAVGSSTVAYGLASARWREGRPTGFLDLQQLGFLAGGDTTDEEAATLGISQLATMHAYLAAHGAELVVVSAHLSVSDRQVASAALSSSRLTVIRLRGDAGTFEAHVRERVSGSDARLAGDDLLGASPAQQAAVVLAALEEQSVLEAADDDDAVVDVSGRTVPDVLVEIERKLPGGTWLPSGG